MKKAIEFSKVCKIEKANLFKTDSRFFGTADYNEFKSYMCSHNTSNFKDKQAIDIKKDNLIYRVYIVLDDECKSVTIHEVFVFDENEFDYSEDNNEEYLNIEHETYGFIDMILYSDYVNDAAHLYLDGDLKTAREVLSFMGNLAADRIYKQLVKINDMVPDEERFETFLYCVIRELNQLVYLPEIRDDDNFELIPRIG